jgi:colanic acid biosynthesis glycosyl transferase WcaI
LKYLLLNQTFYPDVMATGQYLQEVALDLAGRGHEVTVVASRRAYDCPERRFPKFETWRGIRVHRVGSTGFGKTAKWRRAADFGSFMICCAARLILLPRPDVIVALTSPPLISFLGACLARWRGCRFFYWVMDFNPDQAVAAGWLRADSFSGKLLERMSLFSLRGATKVIVLDRFMRDRIVAKGVRPEKVAVARLWSHDGEIQFDREGRERFRQEHGLAGKFVVMHAGNHSPCHPLDTLLEAARRLRHDPNVVFCFVGGGSEFRKLQELSGGTAQRPSVGTVPQASVGTVKRPSAEKPEKPENLSYCHMTESKPVGDAQSARGLGGANVLCLPYQPLAQLSAVLCAADLHVVAMGDAFVGIVHPCKIYNILSVGAPVLYIGPRLSHVSDLLDSLNDDYLRATAAHGEVDRVVNEIQRLRQSIGDHRRDNPLALNSGHSKRTALPGFTSIVEST